MKTKITKLVLLLLAVLTTGSVNAATETYDFSKLTTGQYTESGTTSCDKVNSQNMNLLKIGDETFDNRFAVNRAGTTTANSAWETKAYSTHSGLFSCWDARYLTILGLHNGDKINIVWSTESSNGASLKFYGQPALDGVSSDVAVTSSNDYTVKTDAESVNINLVTDKGSETNGNATKVYIKSVTIVTASVSVPVTINVIPDATTEEYDFQALGLAQASEGTVDVTFGTEVLTSPASIKLISFSTNTFNNRFAGNRDWAIRKHSSATYCALYNKNGYYGRYLAICDLKAGDKVTIKFMCDADQSLIFQNAIVDGVTAGNAVVSEQEYTVKTDGALILDEGANTSGKRVYIYKVTIVPASSSTGTYIGATLVSGKALDFTSVDDITAYVATSASAGSVTFSKVTKVVANTPLYIKANATSGSAINVEIPEATEGAVDYSATNLLKGSATQTTNVQSTNETKYYVFGVQNNTPGFYNAASSFTSAAGKAYLQLTAAQAGAAPSLNLIFDGDDGLSTGIDKVQGSGSKAQGSDAYYNLAGQRVAQPTRGLYIVNGKKVIIK